MQLACFCCPAAQLTIQPSRPLQLPVSTSPPFSPLRLIKLLKPWRDEASDEEGSEGEEEGGDGPQGPPVGQQVGTFLLSFFVHNDGQHSGASFLRPRRACSPLGLLTPLRLPRACLLTASSLQALALHITF